MNIKYHMAIVGCGRLGGRFAKELCRFVCTMRNANVERIALFDGAVIDASDIGGQEFYHEDIGWHKSAVLAGVYQEMFEGVNVRGYGVLDDSASLYTGVSLTNVYNPHGRVAVLFDMSNGSRLAAGAIRKFFYSYPNCIVMTPVKDTLHVAVRLAGTTMTPPKKSEKRKYSVTESARICRLCLAKTAQLLTKGDLLHNSLKLDRDGLGVTSYEKAASRIQTAVTKTVPYALGDEPLLCVTVGCGGTGGNFIKEFVHTQMRENDRVSLLLIDGDRVEEKNLSRQPFHERDVLQNKAWSLRMDLLGELPELNGRLYDYPFYLDTVEDLSKAVEQTECSGKILLVGAVDNHRARQVLEKYYHTLTDCV